MSLIDSLFALPEFSYNLYMSDDKKNEPKRGFFGCCSGSCLGLLGMFLICLQLRGLSPGNAPFNEIDLGVYLLIGFIAGGVLGIILSGSKKRGH